MKLVSVKKEGYMFGAEDDSAELLHEALGYKLYSTYKHVRTGFPIVGYDTVKKRLQKQGIDLFVEDMSEEEIYTYMSEHGYTVSSEEGDEVLFVLNCLLEGIDPTNGLEVEKDSFLYDTMVQKALVQARDIVAKKTKSKKKNCKLGSFESTILVEDFYAIIDENGEIKTDIILFKKLKDWRLNIMKQERVAGYTIFHDKTLIAFATYFPTTKEEFLRINGAGEFKWEKYGEAITQLIVKHKNEKMLFF